MIFRKNVMVLITSVIVVLIASWLIGLSQSQIVDGMTLVIATVGLSLLFEDLWYKMLNNRDMLTWEYFVGTAIGMGAVIAFLWASESETNGEMFIRLGVCTFLCVVGFYWFSVYWKRSISDVETAEAAHWERLQKKVTKAKTRDKAEKLLNHSLRYRVVGDSLAGELDFEHPLAIFREELMTYEDLCAAVPADKEEERDLSEKRADASDYIKNLLDTSIPEPAVQPGTGVMQG